MCIACGNCAIERGVLYICLPRKPRGPNLLEEAYGRLHSVPCLLTLEVLGGRRAPGIRVTRLTGKDAQPLQSVKTVITAVLTDTSGPENSQNKWLLDMWMNYDDDDEITLLLSLLNSSSGSCGLNGCLSIT
jgi:hypothetical protein